MLLLELRECGERPRDIAEQALRHRTQVQSVPMFWRTPQEHLGRLQGLCEPLRLEELADAAHLELAWRRRVHVGTLHARALLSALCGRVRALKNMVSRQQATMVANTPPQPQRSAIQPTPVPAIAEPNT